jgi:hypothetical protein
MRPVVRPVLRDVMSPSHISDSIKYALFSANEQGALYDLYDQSTLFQDAAGTTPWTTLGQPLGLQRDKSKGLVRSANLVTNGDFASATGWTAGAGWAIGSGVATATTSSADLSTDIGAVATRWYVVTFTVTRTAGSLTVIASGTAKTTPTISESGTYTLYILAAGAGSTLIFRGSGFSGTIDNVSAVYEQGNHRYQTTSASRPTIEARVNRFVGTETLATQNVTTVAGGYILRFTGAGTVTLSGTAVGAYSAGTHSITCTAGTLTATVAGTVTQADLRLSLDSAYPYQRVTTATDYADIGAPPRIKYDGIDDFLQTAAVDFSATDKMTVWAGVRKLSAATSMVVESGTDVGSVNGTFALYVSSGMRYGSRGTSTRTAIHASSAVSNEVVTAYSSITTDACSLRINGALVANDSADQGTGNFGNYPLYFGSRAGTSLRFSGEVFSPEVIRGAESTAAQIDMVERIINRNMGGIY